MESKLTLKRSELETIVSKMVKAEVDRVDPRKGSDGYGSEELRKLAQEQVNLVEKIRASIYKHYQGLNAKGLVTEEWDKLSKDYVRHQDEAVKCLLDLEKVYSESFPSQKKKETEEETEEESVEETPEAEESSNKIESVYLESIDDLTNSFIGSDELYALYQEGFFVDNLPGELEHEIKFRSYFALCVEDRNGSHKGLIFFRKVDKQIVENYMHQFVDISKQIKDANVSKREELIAEMEGMYDVLPIEDQIELTEEEATELAGREYDFIGSLFKF